MCARVHECDSGDILTSTAPRLNGRNRHRLRCYGETVEQPRAAGRDQIRLTAATAGVRRVPRAVAAALLVRMAQLCGALAVARPVVARVIAAIRVSAAVGLRTGQNVVLIRRIAYAVDRRVFLRQRELLAERVAQPCLVDRVAMELGQVLRDALAATVVPRAAADPVARAHRARSLRAQVRVPRRRATAGGGRERLAVRIGAGDATEIGAVTFPRARDEEGHRLRWRLRR